MFLPYVSYAVQADIEDPEVIRSLGARNLDGVVVAVADDMEASIMATLVSKEMRTICTSAKAKNELHAKVLKKIRSRQHHLPGERNRTKRSQKSCVR